MFESDQAPGNKREVRGNRGVFTVSLDLELIWGTLDKRDWRRNLGRCLIERDQVIGRLLNLFDRYSIRAAWCMVGHLFLDSCDGLHPEIPEFKSDIRSKRHSGSDEQSEPVFYGRQILNRIRSCGTAQEIGCHTFTHVPFTTVSRERAESELAACVAAAHERGLQMRSFVYPRNRVAHQDLLPKYGFGVYRSPEPVWHQTAARRNWIHRIGNITDALFMTPPPVVVPKQERDGLLAVPGSMLWTPSHGARRFVPVELRVRRAFKGLERAASERKIFHLWFHATDMVVRQDAMFGGLERVLKQAARMRDKDRIEIMPLGAILDRSAPPPSAEFRLTEAQR